MLSPLALSAEPLLRVIQAGGFTTFSDLAAKSGRPRSNMARDLTTLEAAGLIERPDTTGALPALTSAGADQLSAIDRANAPTPLHDQIERDPFNPRVDFDEEFVKGLAESIYAEGKLQLLQPLVIRHRAEGPRPYRLVAGEQRWRAIGLLIASGRWPADLPPPSIVKDMTDEEAEVAALIENVQRQNLNPIDEAKRYKHFRDVRGWSTAKIADAANRSQKHVQNLLRCLEELPEEVQARMRLPKDHEEHVGAREARRMFTVSKEPTRPKAPELSPKLALALLELAHKVESAPMTLGEPGHTVLAQRPTGGALATLHERKIISLREWGGQVFAKIQLYTSGAITYLEDSGFYGPKQAEVLWAARTAVMSPQRASEATRGGLYITPELNTEATTAADVSADASAEPEAKPYASSTDKINARLKADRETRETAEKASMEALSAAMGDGLEGVLPHAATAVERYEEAQLTGNADLAVKAIQLMNACAWKLNGGSLFGSESGDDSAGPNIRRHFRKADGEVPTWGYEGRFVMLVDGMFAGVEVKRGLHADLDFHITDLDKPFFSNTGYRSAFLGLGSPLKTNDGAALTVEIARNMRKHVAEHSSKRKPEPIDRECAARHLNRVTWIADLVAAGNVIDGSTLIEAHEAAVEARTEQPETNPVRVEVVQPPAFNEPEAEDVMSKVNKAIGYVWEEIERRPTYAPSQTHLFILADKAVRAVYDCNVPAFLALYGRMLTAAEPGQVKDEIRKTFKRLGVDFRSIDRTLAGDSPDYVEAHRDCYGMVTADEDGLPTIADDPRAPVDGEDEF